ncbi:DUF4355 domain-containing protein [Paenisporosarcina cavernae]|nr:DUF4355 domain-containing protein [Paenisporosarcina cavernae]
MKYELDQLKTLVEKGDKAALDTYLLKGIEKSDMPSVLTTNAEVKSYIDSEKDKHHSTALETWKSNNLESLVEAEVRKRNPEETPEQKRIRELEEKIANGEKATKHAELKSKAMQYATDNNLPAKFASKYIDKFLGDDESATTATLGELKEDLDNLVREAVDKKFKENGRNLQSGSSGQPTTIKSIQEMAAAHNVRNTNQ